MKTRKIFAGIIALTLTASLAACGNTTNSNGDGKKSKKKVSASEAFQTEIDKLSGDALQAKGNTKIAIAMYPTDAKKDLTLKDINDFADNATDYNFKFNIEAAWEDKNFDASVGIGSETLIGIGYDTTNYYVDLSGFKAAFDDELLSESAGAYSVADILSTLKIPEESIKSLIDEYVATDSSSETIDFSSIIDDEAWGKLSKLKDKAEYDGNDIVIKDISTDDLKEFVDAVEDNLSDATGGLIDSGDIDIIDVEPVSYTVETGAAQVMQLSYDDQVMPLDIDIGGVETTPIQPRGDVVAPDGETKENEDKEDVKINYRLSYSEDGINQTHTIEAINDEAGKVEISFTISNTSGPNFDKYASAKTLEEITNNEISAEDLISSIIGAAALSGGNDYDYDSDYDFYYDPENPWNDDWDLDINTDDWNFDINTDDWNFDINTDNNTSTGTSTGSTSGCSTIIIDGATNTVSDPQARFRIPAGWVSDPNKHYSDGDTYNNSNYPYSYIKTTFRDNKLYSIVVSNGDMENYPNILVGEYVMFGCTTANVKALMGDPVAEESSGNNSALVYRDDIGELQLSFKNDQLYAVTLTAK